MGNNLWMDMAQMQFMDNTPQFRQQQEEYKLSTKSIDVVIQYYSGKTGCEKQYSRKQILYYQFLQLVREYSTREHQVAFLCRQAMYHITIFE